MSKSETTTETQVKPAAGMNRRHVLQGLGAVASMAYAGAAMSAGSGHDHSKHKAQLPDVLNATNDCLDKGQRCIAHCLVSFQEGSTELADCASKVSEMQAICGGFSYLLASNSEYLKAYAPVCAKACKDCEDECRKHEEHVECKACAEACEELVDQIKMRMS